MTRGVAIARWLHAGNRRLRGAAIKVAVQLSQYTNRAAYESSGKLIAFQSIKAMAADTGLTGRTVQKNIRKLQAVGLVASEPNRGGRHRSNHYTLTLPADDAAETLSRGTPFSDQKRVNAEARNPVPLGPKPCPAGQTNYTNDIKLPSEPNSETEPGGPRLRADALGPPSGEETSKGLGNGHAVAAEPEPPTPKALGPLDQALADLRHQLGEKAKWLVTAKVAGLTDAAITLQVITEAERDKIVRHCETEILEASGASALRFEFAIAVEPPPLRRMP